MAKQKTKFACKECGHETVKWYGKCPGCGKFNTMEEETYFTGKAKVGEAAFIKSGDGKAEPIHLVKLIEHHGFSSGIAELDRVLGGKIVNGSLVLLGGEPGKGKSTILLQVASWIANHVGPVLYVSGEESKSQTKIRWERLGADTERLYVIHSKNMDEIDAACEEIKPVFLIGDSIQTFADTNANGEVGSVSQVKACTNRFMYLSKTKGISTFIVAQVTKEGSIAGPRMLEHMVDTVLYLEGEKYNDLRLLRVHKNRFGSDQELGIFQMEPKGLVEITNPSEYLLENRAKDATGSVVVCISDTRPLLVEIQALVSPIVVEHASPRRTSQGFSRDKLSILLAVLEKKCSVKVSFRDVYANVVGGMRIEEPGADLGMAMAIYSSEKNMSVDPKTLILGEVGLTGEVRPVTSCDQLVKEAQKVGFKRIILPQKNVDIFKAQGLTFPKVKLDGVETVSAAISALF